METEIIKDNSQYSDQELKEIVKELRMFTGTEN